MPQYTVGDPQGHMTIRLKALAFAEADLNTYGPIVRSDQELAARAQEHTATLEREKPTPETQLADDPEGFSALFAQVYQSAYQGLLVGYTGLQEPYRLSAEPRFTTTVNLDDSEDERPFLGLSELQAILKNEQDQRRHTATADGENPNGYLLTLVQVTIHDVQEADLAWHERSCRSVCYAMDGDTLCGIYSSTGVTSELLRGLGLPFAETLVSTLSGNETEAAPSIDPGNPVPQLLESLTLAKPVLYTIGYRQPSAEIALHFLTSRGFPVLDIRERAGSRFDKAYNRARLADRFSGLYHRIPELGNTRHHERGPDVPVVFKDLDTGIKKSEQLVKDAAGQGAIYLCACEDWRECHRSKAAQHLAAILPEITIVHIQPDGSLATIEPEHKVAETDISAGGHDQTEAEEDETEWYDERSVPHEYDRFRYD